MGLEKGSWAFIGNRRNNKTVTTLFDYKMQAEKYIKALGDKRCSVNVCLSPNQFFAWRNRVQLASLHANWVEIDLIEKESDYCPEVEKEVVTEVLQQVSDAGLPQPTGYVLSGSGGMHLYWIYEGFDSYQWQVAQWDQVSRAISKTFKGGRYWRVDPGPTHDPTRAMRAPGTIHGRTGRSVIPYLGGPTYTFKQLANSLGISTDKPPKYKTKKKKKAKSQQVRVKAQANKEQLAQPSSKRKHTIGQWWAKTYYHVLNNIQQGVSVGKRNNTAFILYVALKHMMSEEKALATIKSVNDAFIKLPEKELLRNLSTATKTHYKFRKGTLAAWLEQLDISTGYLFATKKSEKISRQDLKQRQVQSAQRTAQLKQQRTFLQLTEAVTNLVKTRSKVTQEMIAQVASLSVRTVRRYWGALKNKQDISCMLYISPPYASI